MGKQTKNLVKAGVVTLLASFCLTVWMSVPVPAETPSSSSGGALMPPAPKAGTNAAKAENKTEGNSPSSLMPPEIAPSTEIQQEPVIQPIQPVQPREPVQSR